VQIVRKIVSVGFAERLEEVRRALRSLRHQRA
jgi:hypothetical protein